jgi:hypothetical protein
MLRSLVAALGFITVLSTLIIVGVLMVNSFGASLGGGSGGDTPSGGGTNSLVLRISGTPGVQFSGNYTTAQGSQDISATLGAASSDYKLGGEGVAGMSVVTVNVQKQGTYGSLKVEILKDGQVVQSAETNATNNAVSVTASV